MFEIWFDVRTIWNTNFKKILKSNIKDIIRIYNKFISCKNIWVDIKKNCRIIKKHKENVKKKANIAMDEYQCDGRFLENF